MMFGHKRNAARTDTLRRSLQALERFMQDQECRVAQQLNTRVAVGEDFIGCADDRYVFHNRLLGPLRMPRDLEVRK